jgi:hypothetical protein
VKKTTQHYVDNQAFLKALKVYRRQCQVAKKKKRELPRMSEFLGECLLKIATHLSYKPNFVNYTFRDDMISDGIENCLVYVHNFDPEKSSNPFGYFTQIIFYAFIRRIQREKKHTYIKYKLAEKQHIDGTGYTHASGEVGQVVAASEMLSFENVQDFISRYDDYTHKRRERRRVTKKKNGEPKEVVVHAV